MEYCKNTNHKTVEAVERERERERERAVFYRIGFISNIIKYVKSKKDGIYAKNLKHKDFLRYILSFLCVKKKNICEKIKILQIKNKLEEVI